MANRAQLAILTLQDSLGNSRTWRVDAQAASVAAGGSIALIFGTSTTGLAPPGAADTVTLTFKDTNTNVIKTIDLTAYINGQTPPAFYFKVGGVVGGADRSGLVFMDIRVTKTTGGPTATYDYETDGSPATPPSGGSASQADRGVIRGTTTGVVTHSNVSYGGAKPSVFAYTTPVAGDGGDTVYQQLTFAVPQFTPNTSALSLSLKKTSDNGFVANPSSQASSASTFGADYVRVIDNRLPAGVTQLDALVTEGTIPLASGGTAPLTGGLTTITTDPFNADPRLTRTPLFQLDDNTFGTPPLSKDFPSHLRQSTQQGFLSERLTNARGEGVNGITYTVTLTPTKPGSTLSNSGLVSQVQGGQDGWGPSFLAWASSLPGGTWTKALTVTAPADITGSAYNVLVAGGSLTYSLVAANPALRVVVTANHPTEAAGHMRPGLVLAIIAHVVDRATGIRVPFSQITNPRVVATRNNPNAATPGLNNGRQYLNSDSDTTSAAWVTWAAGDPYVTHPMAVSGLDTTVFEKSFTNSAGWSFRDIIWAVACEIDGVTYAGETFTEMTDGINQHDKYVFDGAGFIGFPSK